MGTRVVFDKRTLRKKYGAAFAAAIRRYEHDDGNFLNEMAGGAAGDPVPGDEPIQVFARKRPMFPEEAAAGEFDVVAASPHGLLVHAARMRPDLRTAFFATHYSPLFAFGEAAANGDVVARIGLGELLDTAARGGDSALCCFGQTGSGKSYTMAAVLRAASGLLFGPRGLLAAEGLRLQVAAYEVCGAAALDLLAGRAKLRVREDAAGCVVLDAAAADALDAGALAALLAAAARARLTTATARNPGSSRSHAFYDLRLLPRHAAAPGAARAHGSAAARAPGGAAPGAGPWSGPRGGSLLLECFRQRNAAARAAAAAPAGDGPAAPVHVPYRESMLARLMKRVLEPAGGGGGYGGGVAAARQPRVVVVATVSPCASDTEATLNTLRHAAVMAGLRLDRDADMLLEEWDVGAAAPGRATGQAAAAAMAAAGGCSPGLPRLPPAKWSAGDVRAWLGAVGGGRYQAAAAALPASVDGKALTRFPELRFKQLFGSDDAAARRGRALFELFRDEVRAHSAARLEQAQAVAAAGDEELPLGLKPVDISVDVDVLLERPEEALLPALQLLPGPWAAAALEDISVCRLSGAMTNLVYRCSVAPRGVEEAVVLARIHANKGTGGGGGGGGGGSGGGDAPHQRAPDGLDDGEGGGSALFDRAEEVATFAAVSSAGLGPRLLMLFGNGRLEEFLVEYVTLSAHDLPDPGVSAAIAGAMAAFHVKVTDLLAAKRAAASGGDGGGGAGGRVLVFDRLRDWLRIAARLWGADALEAWLGAAGLAEEIDALEAHLLGAHPVWIAECHNDLQYGNIMALAPSAPGEPCAMRGPLPHGGGGAEDRAGAGAFPEAAGGARASDCGSSSSSSSSSDGGGWDAASPPRRGRARLLLPDGDRRVRGQSPDSKRGAGSFTGGSFSGGPGGGPRLGSSPRSGVSAAGRGRPAAPSAASDASTWGCSGLADAAPAGAAGSAGGRGGAAGGGGAEAGGAAGAAAARDVVRLIDYEYAGAAPIAMDIANHWCEWAANYHTDTPDLLDFARCPSPQQQAAFVDAYLAGLASALGLAPPPVAAAGGGGGGDEPAADGGGGGGVERDPARLRSVWAWLAAHGVAARALPPAGAWAALGSQLLGAARAYECVSHLQWALWGVIQSVDSACPDFDYRSYAAQRWGRYRATRPAAITE
ncbi:MAG: hypothetical protein J3K34DRAFT_520125 [Monoraphidium minutum]|nr:MAG: hypothetical protein J3K34DRAFT_520125 [Monoraphidium minutum]